MKYKHKCIRTECPHQGYGLCKNVASVSLGCTLHVKPKHRQDALIYIVEELIGDLMIHLGHDRVKRYMDRLYKIKKMGEL